MIIYISKEQAIEVHKKPLNIAVGGIMVYLISVFCIVL